jgi:hypothetical protein
VRVSSLAKRVTFDVDACDIKVGQQWIEFVTTTALRGVWRVIEVDRSEGFVYLGAERRKVGFGSFLSGWALVVEEGAA